MGYNRWVCHVWMTLGGWVPYGLQQVGVSCVDDTGWVGPIWVTTGGCVPCTNMPHPSGRLSAPLLP